MTLTQLAPRFCSGTSVVTLMHPQHRLFALCAERANPFHLKLLQILQLFTSFVINKGYDNAIVTQNELSLVTNDRIQSWEYLVTLKQRTTFICKWQLYVKPLLDCPQNHALIMLPVWPTHAE